jgi:hypothetical protein
MGKCWYTIRFGGTDQITTVWQMKCYPAILVSHHVFFVLCIWHHLTSARPSKFVRAVHMRTSCFQSVSSEAITKELFLLIIQDQSVQLLGNKWWRCWNNASADVRPRKKIPCELRSGKRLHLDHGWVFRHLRNKGIHFRITKEWLSPHHSISD